MQERQSKDRERQGVKGYYGHWKACCEEKDSFWKLSYLIWLRKQIYCSLKLVWNKSSPYLFSTVNACYCHHLVLSNPSNKQPMDETKCRHNIFIFFNNLSKCMWLLSMSLRCTLKLHEIKVVVFVLFTFIGRFGLCNPYLKQNILLIFWNDVRINKQLIK